MHFCTEHTSDVHASPAPPAPREPSGAASCCDAAIEDAREFADSEDRGLLRDMASGNRSAVGRLYGVYFSRLLKFFAHLMPRAAPEVLDDLIADTLFDVW